MIARTSGITVQILQYYFKGAELKFARKLDTAIATLELSKKDRSPTDFSKFQTKSKSSFNEEQKGPPD